MKVDVTLRYLRNTLVEIKTTEEIAPGCTAWELSSNLLKAHEQQEGIHFTGANVAILVNGRLASEKTVLSDGDVVKIIPVAAGG